MNHLTYWGWVITGLEGLVNMTHVLVAKQTPLTKAMLARLEKAVAALTANVERAKDKVEDQ